MFWLVWSHGQFFIFTNWHSVICLLFFLFIYLCLFSCDSCAIQCNGILFFGTFKKKKKISFCRRRAGWIWKGWIYSGWCWWRREGRQWWREAEEEEKEEKVDFLSFSCYLHKVLKKKGNGLGCCWKNSMKRGDKYPCLLIDTDWNKLLSFFLLNNLTSLLADIYIYILFNYFPFISFKFEVVLDGKYFSLLF